VESNYVRAVRGGVGFAKTAANYAVSLKAQQEAEFENFTQVLWLDGIERKYIEEVGTMNVFFVINNEVITPNLEGSILPGITRMSAIELLRSWGYKVSERKITIKEVFEAAKNELLDEAFGTGTAAVISPIGQLSWNDKNIIISNNKIGKISQKLYDNLIGMQFGRICAPKGWIEEVK
jgi:branched-chain amino acid aminotransferase